MFRPKKIQGPFKQTEVKGTMKKEGNETVTSCHQFKMTAEDGKSRLTDTANAGTPLRLIQSVPSPKAEPIKLWLAMDVPKD